MSVSDDHVEADTDDERLNLESGDETITAAAPRAAAVLGVVILGIGLLLLWQAWQLPGDLAPQGPRFLPVVLAVAWILLAAAYLAGATASAVGKRARAAGERLDHLPRVTALIAVLVAYAYAIDPIGYVISTAVLFFTCATLLGSRSYIRDAVIAVGLSVAVYFLFSRGLNIYLPPGLLPL